MQGVFNNTVVFSSKALRPVYSEHESANYDTVI